MTTYQFQELPTLDDPDLLRCCLAVQDSRRTLLDFVLHVLPRLESVPVSLPIRVALAALNRMAEGSLAIEILCSKNCVRDAAIVLLSLFELQLDIRYIAEDLNRADTWIDHIQSNRKPWTVRSQLQELFPDPTELDAELALYRQYSMAKHANPVGRTFSFPLAVTRHTLEIDLESQNSRCVRIHLFGLAVNMHRAGAAAAKVFTEAGLDVGLFVNDLRIQADLLSEYNEQHIISVLLSRSAAEHSA